MLNDVKFPPVAQDSESAQPLKPAPHSVPHPNATIHTDSKEPGQHHARTFGEKVHLDPEYAMPMEERGSFFNIGLTVVAGLAAVGVLFVVFWAIR